MFFVTLNIANDRRRMFISQSRGQILRFALPHDFYPIRDTIKFCHLCNSFSPSCVHFKSDESGLRIPYSQAKAKITFRRAHIHDEAWPPGAKRLDTGVEFILIYSKQFWNINAADRA